jgi:pantoate--beta-alanine ligase
MRAARESCDFVVVSLFVNPTQFGANEDLDAYPRDFAGDSAVAEAEGVDVLFAPSVDEMYPPGEGRTTVHVAGLTDGLCGAARPTHFDGVTTVVAKLFSIIGPSRAFFGRKDYQQVAVVAQMARDLDLPVDVVGCPLVREPDGLAMSSRNAYLTGDERRAATVLSRSLEAVASAAAEGEHRGGALVQRVRALVASQPLVALEYAELRDARTLDPVDVIERDAVLAVAARVGRARLIDNVVLSLVGSDIRADLGVRTEEAV